MPLCPSGMPTKRNSIFRTWTRKILRSGHLCGLWVVFFVCCSAIFMLLRLVIGVTICARPCVKCFLFLFFSGYVSPYSPSFLLCRAARAQKEQFDAENPSTQIERHKCVLSSSAFRFLRKEQKKTRTKRGNRRVGVRSQECRLFSEISHCFVLARERALKKKSQRDAVAGVFSLAVAVCSLQSRIVLFLSRFASNNERLFQQRFGEQKSVSYERTASRWINLSFFLRL